MQNLRVGDSICLTFFDSGANTHLIDGQLSRSEELQLISSKAIALGVIGGSRSWLSTEAFDSTWDQDGKYHKITAVGMDNVTSGFGEYNLEEVIQEYKETTSSIESE